MDPKSTANMAAQVVTRDRMETIDVTPTWSGLVPVLSLVLQRSDSEQARREVTEELMKMAKAADQWNAHCKAQGDK
tara:strand:+ start:361 stop:588 length:228 start_codon:yes stop_codon:yes gene_type:complete